MVVAVLQVGAEGGEQLDAAGGEVQGALLLQVREAHAPVRLSLERQEKTSSVHAHRLQKINYNYDIQSTHDDGKLPSKLNCVCVCM